MLAVFPLLFCLQNFPVGGSVGVMSGTDRDIDDNALLRYRITTVATPGNPVPFAITQLTGNVTTTGAIDREAFSEYRVRCVHYESQKV